MDLPPARIIRNYLQLDLPPDSHDSPSMPSSVIMALQKAMDDVSSADMRLIEREFETEPLRLQLPPQPWHDRLRSIRIGPTSILDFGAASPFGSKDAGVRGDAGFSGDKDAGLRSDKYAVSFTINFPHENTDLIPLGRRPYGWRTPTLTSNVQTACRPFR